MQAAVATAAEAWLATSPLEDPDAPTSPFDMDEYVLVPADRARELE